MCNICPSQQGTEKANVLFIIQKPKQGLLPSFVAATPQPGQRPHVLKSYFIRGFIFAKEEVAAKSFARNGTEEGKCPTGGQGSAKAEHQTQLANAGPAEAVTVVERKA